MLRESKSIPEAGKHKEQAVAAELPNLKGSLSS